MTRHPGRPGVAIRPRASRADGSMTRPRRGRPPKGEATASITIRLRVEPSTATRWRETARVMGLTLSEWVRRRCDGGEKNHE